MPASRAMGALAAIGCMLLFGCSSSEDEETPTACLGEGASYRQALAAAPGEVSFEGGTRISDCLVPEQEGGELARTGEPMIEAATALNAEARADPTGPAAIQLGYLVGAVERGSEGIHEDLVRRLNSAARFSPKGAGLLPAEFERTFGQGYAAGLESG
jgi:hypothetical protein